jgi:hypothetical protein
MRASSPQSGGGGGVDPKAGCMEEFDPEVTTGGDDDVDAHDCYDWSRRWRCPRPMEDLSLGILFVLFCSEEMATKIML